VSCCGQRCASTSARSSPTISDRARTRHLALGIILDLATLIRNASAEIPRADRVTVLTMEMGGAPLLFSIEDPDGNNI